MTFRCVAIRHRQTPGVVSSRDRPGRISSRQQSLIDHSSFGRPLVTASGSTACPVTSPARPRPSRRANTRSGSKAREAEPNSDAPLHRTRRQLHQGCGRGAWSEGSAIWNLPHGVDAKKPQGSSSPPSEGLATASERRAASDRFSRHLLDLRGGCSRHRRRLTPAPVLDIYFDYSCSHCAQFEGPPRGDQPAPERRKITLAPPACKAPPAGVDQRRHERDGRGARAPAPVPSFHNAALRDLLPGHSDQNEQHDGGGPGGRRRKVNVLRRSPPSSDPPSTPTSTAEVGQARRQGLQGPGWGTPPSSSG